MADRIPDEALVIRGGRNRPTDIKREMGKHPSGIFGISVECALDIEIGNLAAPLPHTEIGVTTAGKICEAGGDVIRTSGRSPNHATLIGLTPEVASRLFAPTIANPAKRA